MAEKHWHLTTDPQGKSDQGAPIALKKNAEMLKKATRRHSSHPIYTVACSGTVYQCDGCGHEARDARPETWRQDVDDGSAIVADYCEGCFRSLLRLEEEG